MISDEAAERIVRVLRAEPPAESLSGRNVARGLMYFVRKYVPASKVNTPPDPELLRRFHNSDFDTYLEWAGLLLETLVDEKTKAGSGRIFNIYGNAIVNVEKGISLAERRRAL